jgi:hypothetical protein
MEEALFCCDNTQYLIIFYFETVANVNELQSLFVMLTMFKKMAISETAVRY